MHYQKAIALSEFSCRSEQLDCRISTHLKYTIAKFCIPDFVPFALWEDSQGQIGIVSAVNRLPPNLRAWCLTET